MADLIAQGDEAQHRWRRVLPGGQSVVLGRASGVWAVPWDPHVSRRHASLCYRDGRLEVAAVADAHNPIFFRGKASARFSMRPGEHFVIGGTSFTFVRQRVNIPPDAPKPTQQQSFSSQYLKQVQFRNPDHRIEVLSRLPEVIARATGDGELRVLLVSMLLAGVPRADAVAVVAVEGDAQEGGAPAGSVRVLHWDRRLLTAGDFQPSERLIREAVRQRQSVLHVWQGADSAGPQPFTARGNVDWAFCTPVPGTACSGWALYVAGRFHVDLPRVPSASDSHDVREDVKFAEVVAAALSSLREMRLLERRQTTLSQFFSPVVLETLSGEDPDLVLAPRETQVSVLFCDLRGFALEAERHADELLDMLNRVSKALGVMTHQILEQGGVVGDFQGDAAMGFWGWPLPQHDAVQRTCQAALAIRAEFEAAARDAQSPLAGFHAGIGIATGRAVAGKIGTVDQAKVTVFGPVVNLASRLEGMTKILRAPILLDEVTADAVREQVPREAARIRRLAKVRPYGLDRPLVVSEILPPESRYPLLTDEHVAFCDEALDAFLAGRWSEAFELLHRTPTEDRVTDFLTVYIAQHNRTAPPDWNGVITLSSK
ncbi:MAG: adenylate/guanylate cyclase domain-containing protein [Planctomycetota bacterium]|jgi:adenylate cyclase